MTIRVRITNEDERTEKAAIEVFEETKNRESREVRSISAGLLHPGESRTFYIHLLKDLVVREIEP